MTTHPPLHFQTDEQETARQLLQQVMTQVQTDTRWQEEVKNLPTEEMLTKTWEKIIIAAEGMIDATLPDTWTEYVDWLDDADLRSRCQAIRAKHTTSKNAWFALPQEGRNAIAVIQTERILSTLSSLTN
ncbi:MAG TPA: hypothetical protein PKL83_01580 [bacterium]|nr:hypothetical protein [bacterium]